MKPRTVLIIERVDWECARLIRELRALVADVAMAASLDDAVGLGPEPEILVVALQADNVAEQVRRARALFQRSTIAVLGYLPATSAFEAGRAGADALLVKPITGSALLRALGARELPSTEEPRRLSLVRADTLSRYRRAYCKKKGGATISGIPQCRWSCY